MTDMIASNSIDDVALRAREARAACPFLTTKQTAFHLGISPTTLKTMRGQGRGPVCRLHGRSWFYHVIDIETWSNAHRKGESNSS
jgi:hypothetical protein